ncbi:MAG: hypothetical protein JSS65_00385 [Armatimonadetes bacterium]|nr:hypothetical protein [Armatimonadota bacterium]
MNYADQPATGDPAAQLRAVVCVANRVAGLVRDGGTAESLTMGGHWSTTLLGLDDQKLADMAHEVLSALSEAARAGL